METTFRKSTNLLDAQYMHVIFEDYAMAHGYASTGTLFAHFLLSQTMEEATNHNVHESLTYRIRHSMQEVVYNNKVGDAKSIIYKSGFADDSVTTPEHVWFLQVSKQISLDNDVTLEPGGILVASDNYALPAVKWPGMTKWFMADKRTLLFMCDTLGSENPAVLLSERLALRRSYVGVLYIPPPPQPPPMMRSPLLPPTPLTFKQWLATPEFKSTACQQLVEMCGSSKCAAGQEELDYFSMDYRSAYADTTPSLLSQEAVDECISLHIGTFNLTYSTLFENIWKLWMNTHTAEMQAESALFKKWVLGNRRTNYLHFHGPTRDMRTALHEMKGRFLTQKRGIIQDVLVGRVAGIGKWTAEYIAELATAHYW